jgi:hypothetical protein
VVVACSFATQPAESINGPAVHGVPNVLAFAVESTGITNQVGAGNVPLLPATRVPVLGPYLQCAVVCSGGPCTDIEAHVYLSTK